MTDVKHSLALALTLALAAATAQAQEATPPAPAADAPAAEAPAAATPAETPAETPAAEAPAAAPTDAPDGPGTTYIANTFDDWQVQCVRTETGNDPCQMYQLLKDANGSNVADISLLNLPAGGQIVAGANIMTPLETLLTQNVTLKLDTNEAKVYPFTFCAPQGCFARVGLTAEELAAYKKGNKVEMTVVPMAAPDQKVVVNISLKGFTSAYEAVLKANAEATK
ncbi:invasion-associated locus B family protein [Rhodobacter xanthinilyticus]|uniref:Invasion-associated locus B family protein n=1 Tax=Rhodobacter xanthinilyticus TaxID=1850250 RepID=A0A1D9MC73_9RHOB|nr:invasion associated locus B family protein [Rhodobacter xanthinilyticus]AOZ69400.1 invasion-associated locus B family protein [Rhodobacter xanthinilyticus]